MLAGTGTGREVNVGENEPLTREILRQLGVLHTKMDGVGRALETLARVEERQAATKEALDHHWAATDKNSKAIAELAAVVTEMHREGRGRMEIHLLWAVTAGALGAIGWLAKMVLIG